MTAAQPNNARIAEAFSGHRFADAYDALADDLVWTNVGGPTLDGRQEVIDACEHTLAELAGTSTDFLTFRSVVGTDAVVVDTTARYADPDGEASVVASCDLYDFRAGKITAIRSYAVEVTDG